MGAGTRSRPVGFLCHAMITVLTGMLAAMTRSAIRTALVAALAVTVVACANLGVDTREVAPNVRAVLNRDGEVIGYEMFRLDTVGWYEARPTNGDFTLTDIGESRYERDRRREVKQD